jgi:hypothetical protein
MRMKILRFVLGFAGSMIILQAFMPDMLTKTIFTFPDGGITFISMLPITILFLMVYESCNMLGGRIIDTALWLYDDIKNRVPIPTIISNMSIPIIICIYIGYKLYYPIIISYITGVR